MYPATIIRAFPVNGYNPRKLQIYQKGYIFRVVHQNMDSNS